MASSDNTPLFLMMGVLGLAALYLTKQFCPGGALPTDALDGKLCYAGGDNPLYGIVDGVVNIGGAGKSGSTPASYAPGYVGGAAKGCGPGFAFVQGACVCNTTYNRCPAGYGLYNNKTSCGCGNCKTAKCPTGSHSVVGKGGVGCICVKNTSTGTVTGGASSGTGSGGTGGGAIKTPCSGKSGNCTWDCRNAYCWTGISGTRTFKTCTKTGQSANRSTGCSLARSLFLKQNSGTTGTAGGYNPTAVQVLNAKLFIADVINRVVKACCGRAPGTTAVVQGYPSAMTSMAQMNHYSTNTLVKTSIPFAQYFRKVVLAIVGNYKLNMSPICTQQMACLGSKSMSQCGL